MMRRSVIKHEARHAVASLIEANINGDGDLYVSVHDWAEPDVLVFEDCLREIAQFIRPRT